MAKKAKSTFRAKHMAGYKKAIAKPVKRTGVTKATR